MLVPRRAELCSGPEEIYAWMMPFRILVGRLRFKGFSEHRSSCVDTIITTPEVVNRHEQCRELLPTITQGSRASFVLSIRYPNPMYLRDFRMFWTWSWHLRGTVCSEFPTAGLHMPGILAVTTRGLAACGRCVKSCHLDIQTFDAFRIAIALIRTALHTGIRV